MSDKTSNKKIPKRASDIYGSWGTLLLPLDDEDNIDWHILEKEIEILISSKVNGIYSNGTAGEFYAQTHWEYREIQTMLARMCTSRNMPFQIGASFPTEHEMLARIDFAKTLSPTAIQIILPDWFPLSLKEILLFFKKIQSVSEGYRIILYNPPHAKTTLSPESIHVIMNEIPCLAGLKLAGGDETWFHAMQHCFEELSIFIPGHHLATGISLGAHGAYSNVACISPRCAQKWYELIMQDIQKGLQIEKEIRMFMNTKILPFIQVGYSNQACDKAMAYMGGWCPGIHPRLRLPYLGITEKELEVCVPYLFSMLEHFFQLNKETVYQHKGE